MEGGIWIISKNTLQYKEQLRVAERKLDRRRLSFLKARKHCRRHGNEALKLEAVVSVLMLDTMSNRASDLHLVHSRSECGCRKRENDHSLEDFVTIAGKLARQRNSICDLRTQYQSIVRT
jgi:hypothetical protein